jgi:putative membrane protein
MSPLLITQHRRAVLAATAVGTAAVLAFAGPVTAAFSDASGKPVVQSSETVKASLDASGKPEVARLFSQIEASGKGHVSLSDPTATKGLRNLDGWGAPSTSNGNANYRFTVDGEKSFRTVATYDKTKLPVSINATYQLDGKAIKARDLSGKSGKLEVTYKVVNMTGEPTDISYPDGKGNTVTETVSIVTPYVGQLNLDLPKSFDEINSTQNRADQAGDGHGGRLLTWTMVLFEPIGAITQTFGYTAQVDNVVLPSASVQIVPVSPQNHPELKFGQDGFASGAASGRKLADGAVQIDGNLLKLRDGAATLLDGLTQLNSGASDLSAGLADGVPAAIDGSQRLSAGAKDAADGAGRLNAGAGQLAAGANKLALGFNNPNSDNDLIDGSQALAGALGLISGGLGQLDSATTGLPAAKAGAVALQAGVDQLVAGLGSAATPGTVLNGLAQLSGGTTQLQAGVTQLQAGADALADPATGLPAAKGGVDQVKAGLDSALAAAGSIDQLAGGVQIARATAGCAGDVTCVAALTAVLGGIEGAGGLREKTATASGGLGQVSGGLGTAIAGVGTGATPGAATLRGGLAQVAGGLGQAAGGLAQVTGGVNQVKTGLKSGNAASPGIAEGLAQLVSGLTSAVGGIDQLAPGAALANAGAGDLADGIATAGAGTNRLSGGANKLSDGADQLADGLQGELAPGAALLALRLRDLNAAKDGASKIADGLGSAKAGDKQIVTGASQLSSQGTSLLVTSGDETAKSYGKEYATMQALNQKGVDNAMPVGAPKGSTDNRGAFDITLAGVGHEGPGSAGRGIAAIVILAIAAAATTLLRGRFGA